MSLAIQSLIPVDSVDADNPDFRVRLLGVPKMIRGVGEVASLGEAARDLGGHRVLLVTDPGVRRAGHVEAAEAALRGASLEVHVFDQVEENPTTKHVEAGTRLARKHEVDLLVGLGGGSPMDCCKGINFLLTNSINSNKPISTTTNCTF